MRLRRTRESAGLRKVTSNETTRAVQTLEIRSDPTRSAELLSYYDLTCSGRIQLETRGFGDVFS